MTAKDAGAPARCRACAADLEPGAARCARCGAAQGEDTCPHCQAIAGASPHDELRLRCDVCGGPRVAGPRAGLSGREIAPLRRAHAAASSRAAWRAASVAGGLLLGFDALLLGLLILILGASFGLLLAGLATLVPLAVFVLWAMRRAQARGREIGPALDAAWLAAATDVATQAGGALSAAELAAALSIEEPQAEELLALLEVNDMVRAPAAAGPRVRIGAAAAAAPAAGAMAAAEEEALAAEEAALAPPERSAGVEPPRR